MVFSSFLSAFGEGQSPSAPHIRFSLYILQHDTAQRGIFTDINEE